MQIAQCKMQKALNDAVLYAVTHRSTSSDGGTNASRRLKNTILLGNRNMLAAIYRKIICSLLETNVDRLYTQSRDSTLTDKKQDMALVHRDLSYSYYYYYKKSGSERSYCVTRSKTRSSEILSADLILTGQKIRGVFFPLSGNMNQIQIRRRPYIVFLFGNKKEKKKSIEVWRY